MTTDDLTGALLGVGALVFGVAMIYLGETQRFGIPKWQGEKGWIFAGAGAITLAYSIGRWAHLFH